ncbi:uncharacterized protein LOC21401380 [Morus notabilis]|uniref:uncharacterized protein LOC21401380 n=1 Tax=Morus notabilis TaxID=981085 RepID=UPI000CED7EF1|nr:uncharacterized protein LOC21401380 [Morus notabilis]
MAREHETSVQPWGTLEELLLACAVNRHGTKSWDSIAMEVQNRTSSAFLTPENCRHKFDDLKRRFMMSDKDDDEKSSSTMVDQLKKIRVDELRREVRRRDDSIVSLELKVKRMEEERERSLKEEEASGPEKKKKNLDGDDGVTGAGDGETSSENRGGGGGGRSKSGDDGSESCDRENRSFNESNSTGQKRNDFQRNGVVSVKAEPGPEPERNESDRSESERGGKAEEDEGDNVARGENSAKQSSEAQSSMSLSKRKRRRVGGGGGGSSSGEEPEETEGDEVSPATKRLSALKSEPFVKLLGIIRSHRLGSVFQRRLRSQESQRYKNLIRQHMDLQTVEARLEKGLYLDSSLKFFRDLLLVFNNGVVFFRKGSQEHVAARELRALVLKEMSKDKKLVRSQTLTVKREDRNSVVLPKPQNNNVKKSSIIVTCGKRGGSSTKALSSEVSNRKGFDHKKERVVEEKQKSVNEKKINGSFVAIEDKGIRKKRSQERVGRRGSKTGNNGSGESEREFGGNELSSHDALEVKMDKKEAVKKKQGVASFLKRMKQNSPKQAAEEDVSEEDSEDSKVEKEEEKKRNKGKSKKASPTKERVTRSSTHGKGTKEESQKGKRGVGRPPKRPEKVVAANGKRRRDNADQSEVGVVGGRPRKRSRR